MPNRFSALSALQRAEALADAGTFTPLTAGETNQPLVVGTAQIAGRPAVLALTDGHVHGGTIGVRESGVIARCTEAALNSRAHADAPTTLVLGFDTGGVRVEEGPAALAAASGIGVALARLTLLGLRTAAVISGPRGCFGAPAVMAALPDHILITANARWGLTGPKLLGEVLDGVAPEREAAVATSAETRLANGDAHAVVEDDVSAIRADLQQFITATPPAALSPAARIAASAAVTAALRIRLRAQTAAPSPTPARARDLLKYSFRGNWHPTGPVQRAGLAHAALGTLGSRPALGFIIGPEPVRRGGVGIEEAVVVTDMLRRAVEQPGDRALIVTFLFCQGHAVDYAQERFGLLRALAECLRAMVAARLLGHPIVSVLGGGTYGAAYLSLAAPSHRVLAMRGTSVAPMAPDVLQAFETLRGRKGEPAQPQLADLIPDIRIVESVIRLPRVLREELVRLVETVRPETAAGNQSTDTGSR